MSDRHRPQRWRPRGGAHAWQLHSRTPAQSRVRPPGRCDPGRRSRRCPSSRNRTCFDVCSLSSTVRELSLPRGGSSGRKPAAPLPLPLFSELYVAYGLPHPRLPSNLSATRGVIPPELLSRSCSKGFAPKRVAETTCWLLGSKVTRFTPRLESSAVCKRSSLTYQKLSNTTSRLRYRHKNMQKEVVKRGRKGIGSMDWVGTHL